MTRLTGTGRRVPLGTARSRSVGIAAGGADHQAGDFSSAFVASCDLRLTGLRGQLEHFFAQGGEDNQG